MICLPKLNGDKHRIITSKFQRRATIGGRSSALILNGHKPQFEAHRGSYVNFESSYGF